MGMKHQESIDPKFQRPPAPHPPTPGLYLLNLPLGFLGLGHGKAQRSVTEVGALKITGRPETGLSSGGPVEPQVYFRIYFIFHSVSA